MIITKEQQEALVYNYVKEKRNADECIGFIDGVEKTIELINQNVRLCECLNKSAQTIYENNKSKGFWDNERNVGELLMLVTSELGEAMEAHRKGNFTPGLFKGSSHTPAAFEANIKDTFEDEIADAVIRLLDLAAGLKIDLEWHIRSKVEYNLSRPKLHGKKY
jgi:NTP pyrophosphatase (non-canonical NTP hydrolase)